MNEEIYEQLLATRNKLHQQQRQWRHFVCSMLKFASNMGEERHINHSLLGTYQTRGEHWQDILNALEELKTQACRASVQTEKQETALTSVVSKLKELMNYLTSTFVHLASIVYATDSTKPDIAPKALSLEPHYTTCSEVQDSITRNVENISHDVKHGYQRLALYAHAISETLNCDIDNLL